MLILKVVIQKYSTWLMRRIKIFETWRRGHLWARQWSGGAYRKVGAINIPGEVHVTANRSITAATDSSGKLAKYSKFLEHQGTRLQNLHSHLVLGMNVTQSFGYKVSNDIGLLSEQHCDHWRSRSCLLLPNEDTAFLTNATSIQGTY